MYVWVFVVVIVVVFSGGGGVRFLFPQDAAMVRSLPMKSKKALAHDVTYTSTRHAGCVHDVTNTDYQARNGSAHGHVFAISERRFLTNWTINRLK